MEYICETKVYTVVELYNSYKERFPQLVKVVQGYYGERAEDVFDKDQVLSIQAVSRQQRVISKFKASTHQERLFSIPSTYVEEMCIVKHRTAGKERMLSDILHDCHLPLTVQFPRDRTISVGDTSENTSNIPNIELLRIFDEVHLLANCIKDGKICTTDVTSVPLFLTQLRLSIITGIRKRSQSQWKNFQEHLQRASSYIEYDLHYGNPNILEYDPSVTYTTIASYTCVAPLRDTNMISLAQRLAIHGVLVQNVNQASHEPGSAHSVHGRPISPHHPQSTHDVYYTKFIKQECDQEYEEIQDTSNSIVTTPTQMKFSKDHQSKLAPGSHLMLPRTTDSPAMGESKIRHSEHTNPMYMASPINENVAPALPQRNVNLPKLQSDYVCETKVYTVAKFHNLFKDDLPQFVSVVQGNNGDRPWHDFHRDQVLCIQAVSKQQRVISKFKDSSSHQFSIPWNYPKKMCIVRQGRAGKEKRLSEILRDAHPPLTVRFEGNGTITDDDARISTNYIPDIKLLTIVDEGHLLAYCITDGRMYTRVVRVPLYLQQLRLSIITGIKGYSQRQWNSFQERLQRASSRIEYDRKYSNPDILEYDPSVIHTDPSTYTYMAPIRYTNMVSLVQRLVGHGPRGHKGNQTLYQHQPAHGGIGANRHRESSRTVYDAKVFRYEATGSSTSATKATLVKEPPFKFDSGSPLLIQRSTSSPASTQNDESNYKPTPPMRMSSSFHENKAPAIPKRTIKYSTPKERNYSNDVPRIVIKPTVHSKQSRPQSPEASTQTISDRVKFSSVSEVNETNDVTKLTIEEVITYLIKLGLGQYEEIFRDQKIDGALLVDLDKDTLMNDLGMKGIEALKITKFVKDGHVPV